MSDEKVLTKEIAEQFLADEYSVDLSEFTAIEDDAAEVLSSSLQGFMSLDGLTEIPDSIAKLLFTGEPYQPNGDPFKPDDNTPLAANVSLNGLSAISDSVAASIGKYRREDVSLRGVAELTDFAAEELSSALDLTLGISSLSDASAKHLGRVPALRLPKLQSLSVTAAESFGNAENAWCLELGAVSEISDNALQHLIKRGGNNLDLGLKAISDQGAEILCKAQVSELYLREVKSLSDAAAKSLFEFEGCLHLYLEDLPKSAAAILRTHPSFDDED